jgi:hypothetical protein
MKKLYLIFVFSLVCSAIFAQFEEAKLAKEDFKNVKAMIGADFALQYQAVENVGKLSGGGDFMPLGNGLNLPTANFTINGELAPGVRVTLETYLSARHHNEAWVKGGYLLMDQLPFLSSDANSIMKNLTLKVGVMELNYGDAHFRRTDNGAALKNAFVGNYVMDAFTTAPALELMFRNNGIIAMAGVTSGTINQSLVGFSDNKDSVINASDFTTYQFMKELAFYGKIGYDKQLNDDLHVRITVSPYYQSYSHRGTLYGGDRTGARFYSVLVPANYTVAGANAAADIKANHLNGNWGPGGTKSITSLMINPFVKFHGLEFFGIYEMAKGKLSNNTEFSYNQLSVEALYRFGKIEQFYGGAKYNTVSNSNKEKVDRIEVAAGWNITKNILAKLEYVNQTYNIATYTAGAGFKGMMFEAAISF